MTDQPPNARRWFQFRLRTLIAFTAICAVACWAVFDGIPRFKEHVRRSQFEGFARELKAGNAYLPFYEALEAFVVDGSFDILMRTDAEGHEFTITPYHFKTVTYFVVERYEESWPPPVMSRSSKPSQTPPPPTSTRLEVFRVPQAPANYQPRSPEVIKQNKQASDSNTRRDPRSWYEDDFAEYVISDRKDDFGLKPELIHSDSIAPITTPAPE